MGHCVGTYCNTSSRGDSQILSLPHPKGQPHVTMEVEPGDVPLEKGFGEQDFTQDRRLNIVQTQGKSNRAPIPEYQEKIDEFIHHAIETNG